METKAKQELFDELYSLDEDSDGVENFSKANEALANSKLLCNFERYDPSDWLAQCPQARIPRRSLDRVARRRPSVSVQLQTAPDEAISTSKIRLTPSCQSFDHGCVQVPKTKTQRKRKRGQSLDMLRESQQIFKGLVIYFFPNDDVAPARSFRIRKAMEWGALWAKEWRDGITHIVVDKSLSKSDLLSFLKIGSLPKSVVLVSETYPSECIRFRFLLDPRQGQYRVSGDEEPVVRAGSPRSLNGSERSLQLKPTKEELAHRLHTPCSSEKVQAAKNDMPDQAVYLEPTHVSDSLQSSNDYAHDALSEAIEEAQATKDLPIDSDKDDDAENVAVPSISDEEGSEQEQTSHKANETSSSKKWQQNFSCMTRHDSTGNVENPNARTIEILEQMAHYYDHTKDHWRTTAYRRAISALKRHITKVTTAKEAVVIPSIGQRLADKIEEIVWTDRLRRLESTKDEPNSATLQLFTKIYGVGLSRASKWVDQGHRTIQDLLSKVQLTQIQKIGIEHLDDFQARIPRAEMDMHDAYVQNTAQAIDPAVKIIIGGSYRRGSRDCGDIDFIVSKPNCRIESLRSIVMEGLIPKLFECGYLRAALATSDKTAGTKWHGAAALPGSSVWRRIDFLLVPGEELGAALIYFTGNDIFNRSIRLLASKKGLRLNQHGLWKDVMRGEKRARLTQGTLVEGRDEKKIFEWLGVPWRPPEHRIC